MVKAQAAEFTNTYCKITNTNQNCESTELDLTVKMHYNTTLLVDKCPF